MKKLKAPRSQAPSSESQVESRSIRSRIRVFLDITRTRTYIRPNRPCIEIIRSMPGDLEGEEDLFELTSKVPVILCDQSGRDVTEPGPNDTR